MGTAQQKLGCVCMKDYAYFYSRSYGDAQRIGPDRVRIDAISCMIYQLILHTVRARQDRQGSRKACLLCGEIGLCCAYDRHASCAAWCVKIAPPD